MIASNDMREVMMMYRTCPVSILCRERWSQVTPIKGLVWGFRAGVDEDILLTQFVHADTVNPYRANKMRSKVNTTTSARNFHRRMEFSLKGLPFAMTPIMPTGKIGIVSHMLMYSLDMVL